MTFYTLPLIKWTLVDLNFSMSYSKSLLDSKGKQKQVFNLKIWTYFLQLGENLPMYIALNLYRYILIPKSETGTQISKNKKKVKWKLGLQFWLQNLKAIMKFWLIFSCGSLGGICPGSELLTGEIEALEQLRGKSGIWAIGKGARAVGWKENLFLFLVN
jgi:hypothetical protein